jgi:CubicO group peptidase (beta-lactamase class C family)
MRGQAGANALCEDAMNKDPPIVGHVAPGFEGVRDAFVTNFHRAGEDREHGGALAVYLHGECVVDLWGGYADAARRRPWSRDTLINVWSATKGIVAAAVATLVDQGRLSYDDPVSKHWPEFAAAGKARVTVAQVMSHQCGLNGFRAATSQGDLYDWDRIVARLAAQEPFWPPGTAASYHAVTYGYLAGEIVRRVSGQTVGAFVRDAVATPLGADFHLGLPEGLDWRAAEILAPLAPPALTSGPPRPEIPAHALDNPRPEPTWPNDRLWRAAEIPAANGQASAQGLARIYGALANGGALDGVSIISPAGIDRLRTPLFPGPDMLLGERVWCAGVALNVAPAYGPDATTFGHTGWGGAFGCANVERGVGIGYVMNRMGSQLVGNPRGSSLCAAIFAALDAKG